MTVSLPPYTGDRPRCTKCGHDKAATRWTQAFSPCNTFLNAENTYQEQQRLCRCCNRCGYHWDEDLATNDDAAPFRGQVPLGQQFTTGLAYARNGETQLILTHVPSGLNYTMSYPQTKLAGDAERAVVMFQALLDQVDAWQRQPLEAPTEAGQEVR